MTTKPGLERNLDQIQESDPASRGSKLGTLVLASLGGACLIFAAVAQVRRGAPPAPKPIDPLGDLVTRAHAAAPAASADLAGRDVTFPGLLSDDPRPTTALAAVNAPAPTGSTAFVLPPGIPPTPPPATDRLPVVPLPASNVISASPVVTHPRDSLTMMAKEASQPAAGPLADEGHAGNYQLQASSFRTDTEAAAFVTALRQRGHRAYVEAAQVAGRGTWYRVRVGPFRSKREAELYRADFERREHLVPFLVEPPREKAATAKSGEGDLPRAGKRKAQ